jgi:DNA segregation ATPase FtsK/SpoIIIE-like protein
MTQSQNNNQYDEVINEYREYYKAKQNELKEIESNLARLEDPATREKALQDIRPIVEPMIANKKSLDELVLEAKSLIVEKQKASTSMLQFELHIGYDIATKIIKQLEDNGLIGPADGINPRTVYLPKIGKEK